MAVVFEKPSLAQRFLPLFRGFDLPLMLVVALLACAGLVAMYSSGYDHGTRFSDHGRNMLIAGAILFMVAQVPPQKIMLFAVPLYAAGVALLLAVALFGITKKGATRWINVGIVIQPSEIMKIAMPLMLAWWFHRREGQLKPLDFVVAGVLLLLPVALILKQPDLGTSLLVLASGLAVIFFAGLSWRLIVPPVLLGLVGVALLVWYEPQLCADGMRWPVLHDYQQQRICTLLDPSRDPLGKGFHIIQGMIAIGSGGFFGKGFMAGTQTHLEFIPERTTDFIFAAYSEEFGLLGSSLVIGGFTLITMLGFVVAMRAPDYSGALLAAGITVWFAVQAVINIGGVVGAMPVTGLTLPLISYGGSSLMITLAAAGLLLNVARKVQ